MGEIEYSKAAVEVLNILQYMCVQDINKIPKSFIDFLQSIASSEYKINFDIRNKVESFNKLQEKSKELLGFIYITWLCDEQEVEKWKKEIKKEKILKNNENAKKYNPNLLFEKREKSKFTTKAESQVQKLDMVEFKEKKLIVRIIEKIKNFFKGL